MAIYRLGALVPTIHESVFVHPQATVIGDVHIGADSSVWPSAVLRGDFDDGVRIGERTSIQDGTVVHANTVVGDDCIVGHLVHLEGCTIEDRCLIGSGSVVLHRVRVGVGASVGARTLLLDDMEVPPGALAVGFPVRILADRGKGDYTRKGAQVYVEQARRYRAELEQSRLIFGRAV